MPFMEHGNFSKLFGSAARLLIMIAVGLVLSASCGSVRERIQPSTGTDASQPPDNAPQGTQTSPEAQQQLIPCHIDIAAAQRPRPAAEPTPEVIRIQLLEHPHRVIPNNIVLRQNRWYKFIITTGNDWHSFKIRGMGMTVDYEIPPGGEKAPLVHTTNVGVFDIEDGRHYRFLEGKSTVTVIPEGASISTWNSQSCGRFHIHSPTPDANVSAPFIIHGSVMLPDSIGLNVTRIEAWSVGKQVGLTTEFQVSSDPMESMFFLSIPNLPEGTHSLLLVAFLHNGSITATATMPIVVLPESRTIGFTLGYQGNIDFPLGQGIQSLPVFIHGWAAIPGSDKGTGVGAVEIWNGPRESGKFLTEAIYGTYRPDVAEALGDPRFASSGFTAQLSNLPAGALELHVYIRDRESGDYVSPRLRQPPLSRSIYLAEGKVADAAWPVALAPAPDGRLFFAELLTGNIRIVQEGKVLSEPFATLENVSTSGESGFLGLALHLNFPREPYVYAMYVVDNPDTGFPLMQRVVRFRDDEGIGRDPTVILDSLPAATIYAHNGGRIAFGPDGKLYLSIGDTDVPELAQDPMKLEGSILRYNPDGTIPNDNPFPGSPVYATGLRNVFGFAFQPETGNLYATDNGPGGFDEVNKIEPGHNYGWPLHIGIAEAEGFNDPIVLFSIWPERPIGPTGVTFSLEQPELLLFCAFKGFSLRALQLSGPEYNSVSSTTVLSNKCALDVTYSSDGWLYYSTLSAIYRARLDDLLLLYEQSAQ